MMIYKALIPVKSLATAKSRLAPYLSQHQREKLVLDMLHHVVQTLRQSELLEQISVVSADARVLKQAQEWDARARPEEAHGHNPALHAAAVRERMEGAAALLTISADLPLLSICDIRAFIEQSVQHEVVLAPSREGTGTNAILVRPPLALPYLFGPNSLQRHIQAAAQRHLNSVTYSSPGLALDIDTIDDLRDLEALNCERHTKAKLAAHNL